MEEGGPVHFYRACPRHRDELVEKEEGVRERMWCPQGHYTVEFLIVSDEGTKIGRAWVDRPSMIVGEDA